MTSKDDPFGDSTTKAVGQLFKKRLYLPVFPFKMIIQSMLHDEVAAESPEVAIEYVSIPDEKAFLSIKLAVFGEAECVGARHLSKLLNSKSMQELKIMASHIREAFDNPVTSFKTEKLTVDYIDVYNISSFLSQQISQPRQHRIKMTVEIVVTANTFEDCLNVFLRRILEDATKSEKSLKILSSCLKAQTGENTVQDIQISTMKANRQQVLASLKAAVVNDGDIRLEFFIHRQRALLAYQSEAVSYREPSEGFVHVVRYYRLSFRNEKGEARCFSRYPVESVVLGVFQNANEAKIYTSVYKDHLQRISPTQAPSSSSSSGTSSAPEAEGKKSTSDELSLHTFLGHWCEGVVTSWSQGELCNAAEEMILLHCLLAANRSDPTYCIKQLVHLTVSHMGHIRAVRDAILSLRNCIDVLVHCITHSTAVKNQTKGVALKEEETEYLDKLKHMFALLTPFVIQVKRLLLDLVRLQELHSELQYVSEYLTSLLWTMFDKTLQTHPIIAIDLEQANAKKRSLLSVLPVLSTTVSALNRLDESLKMVELSVGSEIYAAILRQDLQSYAMYMDHMKLTPTQTLKPRKESEIPKCFIDLLGYVLAYKAHKHSPNAANPTTFLWKPLVVSESLGYQLLPDERSRTEKEDRQQLLVNIEDNLTLVKHLWEQYSLLGEYPVLRQGGVDFLTSVQDELVRYDVPRFMAIEGVKIRYLSETHVIRAMHEAYFFTSTMPTNRLHFPALCKELFKFPSFQQLWIGVEDSTLEEDIFYSVRKNLVQITSDQRKKKLSVGIFGAHKIGLSNVPTRLKNLISGGVFGSDRVLSALGSNCESLFEAVWNLPPLLPNPANVSSVGINMRMHCGLSVETALLWCTPDLNLLRVEQAAKKVHRDSATAEEEEEEEMHTHLDKKSIFNTMFGRGTTANAARSAAGGQHSRHHRPTQASPPDLDTGLLRTPIPIDLEIVFNAKCEYAENVAKVRALFASEVCRIVRYMLQHNTWNVEQVVVHKEVELTADLGSKPEGLAKTFSHVELADDAHYQAFPVLEDTLKRFGSAVVEGSVLMPESHSRLSANDLLAVFDAMTSEAEEAEQESVRLAAISAGLAPDNPTTGAAPAPTSVPPATPTVAQTSNKSPGGAPAVSPKLTGKASSSMKNNEQVVASVKGFENAFSKRKFSPDDDEEEVEDDSSSIDPTGRDSERLCADSAVSSQVQSRLNTAVKCYVPCRVHFTLVAQVASHNRWRGGGMRGGGTAPVYSRITGHHDKALAVGNDHSIARLVASTLWFNAEAATAMWSHVREGETQCIYHEAVERWKAYHHCLIAGDYCRAYQHGLLSAVLSQNYALCVPMFRACNALAFKLKRVIQVTVACRQMLLQLSGYDVIAFGVTVSRHICLAYRYLLMSPQCSHFRGGCSHILQLIRELEHLLHLSPIPMKAGVTKLPNQLLDVARIDETIKDDFKIQIRYNNENYTSSPAQFNPQPAANGNVTVLTDSYLDRQLNPSAPVGGGGGGSTSGKSRPKAVFISPNSGEAHLRKALSRHADIPDMCRVLQSIEEASQLLLFALSKDFHANFVNVSHVLKDPPQMMPSRQMMDLVLGDDCDFASLLSFIQRAESTTNKQLEDEDYIANMESLQSIKSYKSLRDAVLSMEAVNILHQLAELSDSASSHEKASIASLVKSVIKSQDGEPESESRRNSESQLLAASASGASLATVNSEAPSGVSAEGIAAAVLGGDAGGSNRGGPSLGPKIRAIASLLKGFNNKPRSASGSTGGMTPSASAEKLQIDTDDFHSVQSEMGATFGSPGDAMQFTPDDSSRARDLYKQLAFPPRSGNKLRDAALKINLSRMFSLQEGDEESPERSARPIHGKGVLSHFHEEDELAYRAMIQKQQLVEGSLPAAGNSAITTFSSSGFKLVGDSVKTAADSKSMLQLLRVYGNVDQPVEPLATHVEPRQRFFGVESEEEEEVEAERPPVRNTGSVLDTLRSMGK